MSDFPENQAEQVNDEKDRLANFDPMKLDPNYEYTKKDRKRLSGHNRRKVVSSVLQLAALVLLIGSILYAVFSTKPPEPLTPPRDQWTQRDGFVAISYAGIARNERKGDRPISRQLFERHMQALMDAGYHIITTQDIIDYYWNDAPLPDKALYLMFEGGRKDSAIFSQGILKEFNLRATMYIQTAQLTGRDHFFLRSTELDVLANNPYWEIGSQGYELRNINIMDDGGYGFFLTDYLRDRTRTRTETDEGLRERLEKDYELSYRPFEKFMGRAPEAYIFMPANMLWRSLEGPVEAVNAELLDKYYKIAFAREGLCYNTKGTAAFNLTRMQVRPDWSVNRLLMEIESSSPNRHVYQQADENQFDMWHTESGALSSNEESLILTAPHDQEALALLRGSNAWDNVDVSVNFIGSPRGTQKLFLRYASHQSNICVSLSRNTMQVFENVPRRGTSLLYETFLEYEFDALDLTRDNTTGLVQVGTETQDLGRLRFTLTGNRLTIRYGDEETVLTPDPIPIARSVQQGGIALGALGEDEPYDAVFSGLEARPIDHLWVFADPQTDTEIPEEPQSADIRTCVIVPTSADDEVWQREGARTLYRALSNGQMVFAQLPQGVYDCTLLDRPWSTLPPPGGIARFLSGIILTPGDTPNWASVAQASREARTRDLQVALSLSPTAAASLSEAGERPEADWVILTSGDQLPKELDTTLKRFYDRGHFLGLPEENPDGHEMYVWTGEGE